MRKAKVQLTQENMTTFFAKVTCCNTPQYLLEENLRAFDEYACTECNKPLAYKSEHDGLWYTVGNRIFG